MKKTCFSSIIAILVLAAPMAWADVAISTLDTGNSALSSFAPSYGTVTINLDASGTIATITFTADESHANAYLFGGAQAVDVNVNAATFTIGNYAPTALNGTFTPGPVTFGASNTVDGFGSMNGTNDSFDGFQHSFQSVTFTVTNTSGTWASATDVLTPNVSGFDAGAHIFACSDNAANCNTITSTALATGFAVESGSPVLSGSGSPVPEPTSILLLGTVLCGLTAIVRKKTVRKI